MPIIWLTTDTTITTFAMRKGHQESEEINHAVNSDQLSKKKKLFEQTNLYKPTANKRFDDARFSKRRLKKALAARLQKKMLNDVKKA